MYTGSSLLRLLPLVPICLFIAVTPVSADKNNKFYVNIGRYYGNSGTYFNRAVEELDKGNLTGARQLLDAAIKADNKLWPAYLTRAQILAQMGKYELALKDCNEAARLKPQFTRTFITRSQIYRALGRCSEGVTDLDKVIAIHSTPESVALALSSRAWLHASCKNTSVHNPKKALEDATQACNIDGWHMADYIDTLALAYAVNGDFNSAIKYEKQAIDTGRLTAEELKSARSRLAFYQRQPAR